MKKLLSILAILTFATTAYAYTPFYGGQLGNNVVPGYVLQSTGSSSVANWVATSTLGITGGGGGSVSSVFGRTGAVTAQTGDYSMFYPTYGYASTTYSTYAYGSSTYYFASNPSGYITSSALGPYVPFSYASSTFVTQGTASTSLVTYPYGSSTYYFASNPAGYINSYSTTSPGGLNAQIQYNNSGVFGGISGATTDGTSVSLSNAHLLNPTINGAGTGLATLAYPNTASNATITFPSTTGTLCLTTTCTGATSVGIPGTVQFASTTAGQFDGSSTRLFFDVNNGFLGIGTTTPQLSLYVAGAEFLQKGFRDSTYASGTVGQILSTTGTSTLWINAPTSGGSSVGNAGFIQFASSTPGAFNASSSLFFNNTTGSLGIGTSSPAGTLDVYANNGTGASPSIVIGGMPGGDTDYWLSRVTDNDGTNNDSFQIGSSTVPGTNSMFAINYDGTVGIGTSTPSAGFAVAANTSLSGRNFIMTVASSTSNLFTILGSGQVDIGTTTATIGLVNLPLSNVVAGGIVFGEAGTDLFRGGTALLKTDAAFTSSGLVTGTGGLTSGSGLTIGNSNIQFNGGVGGGARIQPLGTSGEPAGTLGFFNQAQNPRFDTMVIDTTGNRRLVAFGTSSINTNVQIYEVGNNASNTDFMDIATTTTPQGATTSVFRITSAGNVGIGTTTPAALLGFPNATGAANGINFGDASADLYRSAAAIIRTDGAFIATGQISSNSNLIAGATSVIGWGGNPSPQFKNLGNGSNLFSVISSSNSVRTTMAWDAANRLVALGTSTFNLGTQLYEIGTFGSTTNFIDIATTTTVQGATSTVFKVNSDGQITTGSGGQTPTLSACGGGTPTIVGNETTGSVTVGTGLTTSCTLSFQTARANANYTVQISDAAGVFGGASSKSATAMTITFGATAAGDTFDYTILGY